MNRIPTIESALKAAYYDSFINTDAMAREVVKAVGAKPSMSLFYDIEHVICRHWENGTPDWRKLAEEVNAVLPAQAEDDDEPHWLFAHLFEEPTHA